MIKLDVHNREHKLEKEIQRLKSSRKILPSEKKRIYQFIDEIMLGKGVAKKSGIDRTLTYLQFLRTNICPYFKKDLKKLSDKQVTKFYADLDKDKIKRKDGNPYSNETKNEIIKTLKKYERWLNKNNPEKYDKLYRWLKEFNTNKETSALTREEIENLSKIAKTRDAYILMTLFDSGARAEEFLNIRKSDLSKKEDYYLLTIRGTKTKNSYRTISLPIALKYIDAWLNEHPERNEDDFYLCTLTYPALKKMLKRYGVKIDKNFHPHLFRHSSATYYANILGNQFKMEARYGWITGSKMSRRYIDRAGINQKETADIVQKGDYETISKENDSLKERLSLVENDLGKIRQTIAKLPDPIQMVTFLNQKLKKEGSKLRVVENQ